MKNDSRQASIFATTALTAAAAAATTLTLGAVPVAAAAAGGGGSEPAPAAAAAVRLRPLSPIPPGARRLTLSFQNADAADVLRAISMQSGTSIVATPSAHGETVSLRLNNVTADEALALVTQAAGLAYRHTSSAFVVGTDAEMRRLVPDTYVPLQLRHLSPTQARAVLATSTPYVTLNTASAATTTGDSGGPVQITLTGFHDEVEKAARLLADADIPQAPVSEVIAPKNTTAAFLATVARRAVPAATIDVEGNVAVVSGTPEAVAQVKALLPAVDTPGSASRQVEIYKVRYSSAVALATMITAAVPGVLATPSAEPYAPPAGQFHSLSASGSAGTSTSGTANGGGIGGSGGMGTGGGSALGGGGEATGGTGGGGVPGSTGSGSGTVAGNLKSRQLILAGPDAAVTEALRLLKAVDVAPTQVEITAHIVDITNSNDFDLGIQWGSLVSTSTSDSSGSSSGSSSSTVTFAQGTSLSGVTETSAPGVLSFGRFVRSPLSLAAQLQFLESKSRAKTLANPHISAIDNEDASIFIGDIRRYQILANSSATAGNGYTAVEVPVGVTLLVRPHVNDDGEITLKVHPSVSIVSGLVDGLPQTSSREADTTMRIHDGETVVIGGLLRDDEVKTLEQVPLLGSIPFFGELFRHRQTTTTHSQVVIFLTPHLLPDPDSNAAGTTKTAAANQSATAAAAETPPKTAAANDRETHEAH